MKNGSKSELLTPGEVAALFRVDPKTVTRWAKAGRISAIRTPGGHCRFRQADVDALLEGNQPIIALSVDPMPGTAENAVKTSYTRNFTPGEPFVSEAFGPREGYVVGMCRHAVAQSEWNAGFRKCERC